MRMLGLSSLFAAILLGPACGDSTAGSGETGTCPVGSVTCPCTSGGACDNGLVCLSNLCVDPGSGSTDAPTQASGGATASSGSVSDSESAPTTAGPSGDPVTTDISTSTGGPTTGGDEGPKLDVGQDTTTGVPVEGCRKIDMLFVLDGSGSMIEERQALSAINAFTDIVTTLANLNGEIDYRIAVTTDNDDGFVNPNNCWDQPNKWIDSVGNTPASVAKSFNCAVSGFGNNTFEAAVGCEHVLTSAADLLASDKSGFIRKDALLVLVMVTDVDDYGAYDQMNGNSCGIGCATAPTALPTLLQKLVTVKNDDLGGVAAVVIAGDPSLNGGMNFCGQPGSCGCNGLDCGVFHADRLYQFTGMLAGNGYAADLCKGTNSVPLAVKTALTEKIDLACMKFDPPS